jgi:hypothetical protein
MVFVVLLTEELHAQAQASGTVAVSMVIAGLTQIIVEADARPHTVHVLTARAQSRQTGFVVT